MFIDQESQFPEAEGPDFAKCVDLCLGHEAERGLLPKSLKELRRYLGQFSHWCSEQSVAGPGAITTLLLSDFLLSRNYQKREASRKAMVWSLQKLCGYLMVRGWLAENPAKDLRYPRLPPLHKVPTYLHEHQVKALLRASAVSGEFSELLVIGLLTSLGLRSFEVVGLTPKSFRSELGMLEFQTKGGSTQRLPVPTSLATLLNAYLATRALDSPSLFQTRLGTPVDAGWVRRITAQAGERIDLPYVLTPRILRHSFATHAADRHGSVITKRLLGHRFLHTTGVYTHLSPRRFRRLMNLHPYITYPERTHGPS